MEDNLENIEIPEDILELFAAGAFTGNGKDAIKRLSFGRVKKAC